MRISTSIFGTQDYSRTTCALKTNFSGTVDSLYGIGCSHFARDDSIKQGLSTPMECELCKGGQESNAKRGLMQTTERDGRRGVK